MIKANLSKILYCALGSVLMFSALLGQEGEKRERIPVKSRSAVMVKNTSQSSSLVEQEDENDFSMRKSFIAQSQDIEADDRVSHHATYYTSHPGSFQRLAGLSTFGDSLELEDGSIWTVYSGDAYKTQNWLSGDMIVITLNSWYSSYDFKMTNQSTGVSVRTQLTFGPFYDSPSTHWIVAIDYEYNVVILEDGSAWNMSYFDRNVISKWLPNDTVIIGINDGWFSATKPNLLINVNLLNWALGIASY